MTDKVLALAMGHHHVHTLVMRLVSGPGDKGAHASHVAFAAVACALGREGGWHFDSEAWAFSVPRCEAEFAPPALSVGMMMRSRMV